MPPPIGDSFLVLARDATRELLLIAPYIKLGALAKVLSATSLGLPVRVVTRWRLDELASGVSDLSVWPALRDRTDAELWIQPTLHAKYYRADDRFFIGSANLTAAGLGWSASSNLELLVEVSQRVEVRAQFEAEAFRSAKRVDDAMYNAFKEALDAIPQFPRPLETEFQQTVVFADWRPLLRHPQDLWRYYSGERDSLSTASREAAASDLTALDLPPRIGSDVFNSWVALLLRQHPEVQAIEAFGATSRRFGEMRALLTSRGAVDGAHAWQTWMRWLKHFDPARFKFHVANYSEIFEVDQ